MADGPDQDSKTEEASQRKLEDSISKGNVPFSREAPAFATLTAILAVVAFLLKEQGLKLKASLERFIENPAGWSLESTSDAARLLEAVAWDASYFVLPMIAVLMIAGLVASAAQNPPQVALDRIKPDAGKLSLAKGWKRLFGLQGHVEFLKACFKFAVIGAVASITLVSQRHTIINAMLVEPGDLPELIVDIAIRLLAAACIGTVMLMVADVAWSRVSWRRTLRMTRQELKDEHKQTDGDPLVKAKQKSLARDRQRKRMMAAVPRATVVIANPTHYAVALFYEREKGGAPTVLAKGRDLIALRIRRIAEENHIPVIEDKPLARALCETVEVDRMIPSEFYQAVAQIIYFITSRKNQHRTANQV